MLWTSPSIRPSIWMSPVERKLPLIAISALMIEGADSARARLAGAGESGVGGGGGASLLLLENMAAGLDEVVGILHDIVIPDFVMDMRSRAASGGTHPAEIGALADLPSHPHADLGEVTIARVNSVAVVDFHHIAVAAAVASEHHDPRRGCMHHRAPGARKIDPGMEGVAAGKGVDTGAEAARPVEACGRNRHGQLHVFHRRRH